jgi:hypothetical protein
LRIGLKELSQLTKVLVISLPRLAWFWSQYNRLSLRELGDDSRDGLPDHPKFACNGGFDHSGLRKTNDMGFELGCVFFCVWASWKPKIKLSVNVGLAM